MEFGSIERDLFIDAAPATVFEVVSRPEHIADWWSAETDLVAQPGADGALRWVDEQTGRCDTVRITVVEAVPPERLSFRWTHADGERAAPGNSLLVTFDLVPEGTGTRLRMTETGFRERGWEAAVLEEQYRAHEQGWAHFVPRLARRAESVVAP